jgi:hypothetical protein
LYTPRANLIGFILTKAVNPSQLANQTVALSLSQRLSQLLIQ